MARIKAATPEKGFYFSSAKHSSPRHDVKVNTIQMPVGICIVFHAHMHLGVSSFGDANRCKRDTRRDVARARYV